MTACAMTIGMVPMALALERGSEMQAPLGRAVIGGLVMSTFATLLVVPSIFALVIGRKAARSPSIYPDDPDSPHYDPEAFASEGESGDEAAPRRASRSRLTRNPTGPGHAPDGGHADRPGPPRPRRPPLRPEIPDAPRPSAHGSGSFRRLPPARVLAPGRPRRRRAAATSPRPNTRASRSPRPYS